VKYLLIKGYGVSLKVRKEALILKKREKTVALPIGEVDYIIVLTSGVSITSKAIRTLANAGIALVVMDRRGMPVAILHHPFTTKTVETKRKQYEAIMNEKSLEIVKNIAISKISNQAGLLKKLKRDLGIQSLKNDIEKMNEILRKLEKLNIITLENLRKEVLNIEAEAARIYWGSIATILPKDLAFEGRNQEGLDQFNVALNYSYGILYSVVWKALVLAGLDPYAGFLHVDRSGKPVLTYDVVEVFRSAAVDYPLIKMFLSSTRLEVKDGLLTYNSRSKVAEVVINALRSKYVVKDVHKELESWVKTYALNLASYLRDEIKLKPLVFKW